jgi:hypothetical protein
MGQKVVSCLYEWQKELWCMDMGMWDQNASNREQSKARKYGVALAQQWNSSVVRNGLPESLT